MENMKNAFRRGTHTAPKHGETDYRGDAREREIYSVHFFCSNVLLSPYHKCSVGMRRSKIGRGGLVVKAAAHSGEGPGFDSRWGRQAAHA